MIYNSGKLEAKFDRISKVTAEQAVALGIQIVQGAAKNLCPVDYGELRNSIYTDVQQDGDRTIGICYTNKAYAPYVEYGTGPKGQENHRGISPDVHPVYHQGPWWIHESQIDKSAAERYGWFSIDTPEGKFYQCTGQAAQPYMYPALHDNRDNILKIMKRTIGKQVKT